MPVSTIVQCPDAPGAGSWFNAATQRCEPASHLVSQGALWVFLVSLTAAAAMIVAFFVANALPRNDVRGNSDGNSREAGGGGGTVYIHGRLTSAALRATAPATSAAAASRAEAAVARRV